MARLKGSGIEYVNSTPAHTPTLATHSEIAYDVNTGKFWRYNRTTTAWDTVTLDDAVGTDPNTRTSTFTATVNTSHKLNSAGGTFAVNLPDITFDGNTIRLMDVTGSLAANNVTVNAHGSDNIEGVASMVLSQNYGVYIFIADLALNRWILTSEASAVTLVTLDTAYNNFGAAPAKVVVDGTQGQITGIEFQVTDTTNKSALKLTQSDVTNNPVTFDIVNNGTGDAIKILQVTEGKAINILANTIAQPIVDISASRITTGQVFRCINADALTDGSIFNFTSSSNDTSTRALASISNLHALATGAVTLNIGQNSTSEAIAIVKGASGLHVSFADGTDTFGLYNHAGNPVSAITANIGSVCVDTANGFLYVKRSDASDTEWEEIARNVFVVEDQIDFVTNEPAAPTFGQRYINLVSGVTSVTTQIVSANRVYTWTGSDWSGIVPAEGYISYDKAEDTLYWFDGTAWVTFDLHTIQTLTDAASITWDLDLGRCAEVSVAGNRTFVCPTGITDGQLYSLIVYASGGTRTISFDTCYTQNDGYPHPDMTIPSGQSTSFVFIGKKGKLVSTAHNISGLPDITAVTHAEDYIEIFDNSEDQNKRVTVDALLSGATTFTLADVASVQDTSATTQSILVGDTINIQNGLHITGKNIRLGGDLDIDTIIDTGLVGTDSFDFQVQKTVGSETISLINTDNIHGSGLNFVGLARQNGGTSQSLCGIVNPGTLDWIYLTHQVVATSVASYLRIDPSGAELASDDTNGANTYSSTVSTTPTTLSLSYSDVTNGLSSFITLNSTVASVIVSESAGVNKLKLEANTTTREIVMEVAEDVDYASDTITSAITHIHTWDISASTNTMAYSELHYYNFAPVYDTILIDVATVSGGTASSLFQVRCDGTLSAPLLLAFDDDAAAGVGGLSAGDIYQTTGGGAAPLNAAGILVLKQ